MEYRVNKRTGDKISVLSFGTSYIAEAPEKEAVETIRRAYSGGVNYFDLAHNGDTMAAEHYRGLSKHANDCVQCGHCNSRCPFRVDQMARMKEITEHFQSI